MAASSSLTHSALAADLLNLWQEASPLKRLIFAKPLVLLCTAMLATTNSASSQETDDHKAIRDLLTHDQEAWISGDGKAVLENRIADYVVCRVPRNNGLPDFHGVIVDDMAQMREQLSDPGWQGNSAAFADTALNTQANWNMVRIDIKGTNAVAISRIEWSQNDTTRNVRVRGGWESLWFLRKIDDKWKFTSAVGFINHWKEDQ